MALLNDPIADKTARLKARLAKQAQLARQIPGVPSGQPLNEAPGINKGVTSAGTSAQPNARIVLPDAGTTVSESRVVGTNPNAPDPLPAKAEQNLRSGQFETPTREQQLKQAAVQKQNTLAGPHAGPQQTMDTRVAVDPQKIEHTQGSPFKTEAPADDINLRKGQLIRADGTVVEQTFDPRNKTSVDTDTFNANQRELQVAEAKRIMNNAGATTTDKFGRMLNAAGKVVGQLPQNLISGDLAKATGTVAGANVEGAQAGFNEGVEARQAADIDSKIEAGFDQPQDLSDADRTTAPKDTPDGNAAELKDAVGGEGKPKSERNIFRKTLDGLLSTSATLGKAIRAGVNAPVTASKAAVEATKNISKSQPVRGGIKGVSAAGLFDLGLNLFNTITQEQEKAPQVIAEQTGLAVGHIMGRLQRGEYIELAQEAAIGTADIPARLLAEGSEAGAYLLGLNAQLAGNAADALGFDAGIFGPSQITGENVDIGATVQDVSRDEYNSLYGGNQLTQALKYGSVGSDLVPNVQQGIEQGVTAFNEQNEENKRLASESIGQEYPPAEEAPPELGQALIDQSFSGGGGGTGTALATQPQMVNGRDISQLPNEQRDINESRGLRAANNEILGRQERTFDGYTGQQMSRDANLRTDGKTIDPGPYGRRNRFSENPLANFTGELSRARRQSASASFDQEDRRQQNLSNIAGLRAASSAGGDRATEANRIYDQYADPETRPIAIRRAVSQLTQAATDGTYDSSDPVNVAAQDMIFQDLMNNANPGLLGAFWNSMTPAFMGGGGRGLVDFLNGDPIINSQNITSSLAIDSEGDIVIDSQDPTVRGIDIGNEMDASLLNFLKRSITRRIE